MHWYHRREVGHNRQVYQSLKILSIDSWNGFRGNLVHEAKETDVIVIKWWNDGIATPCI